MKVAINSKTFRVVDDGKVTDYHITDGSASRHMMKVVEGGGEGYVLTNIVKMYSDKVEISDETIIFNWCSDSDSKILAKINYVDVTESIIEDSSSEYHLNYTPYMYRPSPRPYYIASPVEDVSTRNAFKQLFGN